MEGQRIMTSPYMDAVERKWFAVQTKFKCEKYVARHLEKKGILVYIPLIEELKIYASKKKKVVKPLINCYVFVYVNKDDYIKVLETEYVYGFLKNGKEIIRIPLKEIDLLKRVVGECGDVMIENHSYREGEAVEIISGNLTGIAGIVVEKEGKHNVVVYLENMGFDLRISVNQSMLSPKKYVLNH